MSDAIREAFEKVFPVPRCCVWNEVEKAYYLHLDMEPTEREERVVSRHFNRWQAWQAALQHRGEPVGEVFEVLCEGRIVYAEVYDGAVIPHKAKLYTAQQAVVPEGYRVERGSVTYNEILITAPDGGQQIFWPDDAAYELIKALLIAGGETDNAI
jgi:hypothetical protein